MHPAQIKGIVCQATGVISWKRRMVHVASKTEEPCEGGPRFVTRAYPTPKADICARLLQCKVIELTDHVVTSKSAQHTR